MLTEPQRALISTISEGQKAVEQAERILETKLEVPDLGTDPVIFIFLFLYFCFSVSLDDLGRVYLYIYIFGSYFVGLVEVETDSAGHEQAECVVADCRHECGHGQRHYIDFRFVLFVSIFKNEVTV